MDIPLKGSGDRALALAAISLCQSLLVTMQEKALLSSADVDETIYTAAETNLHAVDSSFTTAEHEAAARLLQRLLRRADGMR